MPRASFVLGIIASAMVHIFFGNRRHEQTDSVTEDVVDAESGAYTQPHAHEESSAFENWLCDICDFDNRALRSTSARKSARTCSNCGNDFIYKISPRKHAHKALIEARPVQVSETGDERRREASLRDNARTDVWRFRCGDSRALSRRERRALLSILCAIE